ncbi:MAG: hypothetical protein KGJ09_10530 [Candidatus Omnitrophica bacterium]|nr:hypothetical protein [Candidatus Omnitrophota bacterium]MDE2232455.1 hypothetical protein [Candidatus Omnitrophota bacterium]
MTKQNEKDMFGMMVAGCPDGYVRSILEGITIQVNNAIDNDFGFIDVVSTWHQQQECREEIKKLSGYRDCLKNDIVALEKQKSKLQDGLADLRNEARRLAS